MPMRMMRVSKWSCLSILLFAVGYLAGQQQLLSQQQAAAQEEEEESIRSQLSVEANDKLQDVYTSINGATAVLQGESRHRSAIVGFNSFGVTVGGLDAIRDLEEGRGVDPETFAGLYAGLAIEEVSPHIAFNEDGQLTYKDKIVRMYPTSRLKRLYGERLKMAGLGK